jgi:hypothetical protein
MSNLPAQSHTFKIKWVRRKLKAICGQFLISNITTELAEHSQYVLAPSHLSVPSRMNIVLGLLYDPSWLRKHVTIGNTEPEYLPRVSYHGMPNINFAGPLLLKMQQSARNSLVDAFTLFFQSEKYIYRGFFCNQAQNGIKVG